MVSVARSTLSDRMQTRKGLRMDCYIGIHCRLFRREKNIVTTGKDTTGHRLPQEEEQPQPAITSLITIQTRKKGKQTCASSRPYCSMRAGSTCTSAGASAGAA